MPGSHSQLHGLTVSVRMHRNAGTAAPGEDANAIAVLEKPRRGFLGHDHGIAVVEPDGNFLGSLARDRFLGRLADDRARHTGGCLANGPTNTVSAAGSGSTDDAATVHAEVRSLALDRHLTHLRYNPRVDPLQDIRLRGRNNPT